MRPERPGRVMAVDAGRAHWQRRAKRAAALAAAPCPASAERALLPLLGKFKSKQASKPSSEQDAYNDPHRSYCRLVTTQVSARRTALLAEGDKSRVYNRQDIGIEARWPSPWAGRQPLMR
jgi:hypothetical protein